MNLYTKRLLLKIVFVTFSLLLLLNPTFGTNKKSASQSQTINNVSVELPMRLIIPNINVDASVKYVGLTPKREMEVPKNSADVGWYDLGPRPGEKGSAVIDGHFNNENGEAGVFFNLYQLKKGGRVYVQDNRGKLITFVVQESRLYDPGLAGEVFSLNDGIAHLNLVTCDGVWDGVEKSYSKRLVVFADLEN